MAKYDSNGTSYLDIYKEHYYTEYDVPCKNNRTIKLLAFKMNTPIYGPSKKVGNYPLLDNVVKMKIRQINPEYKEKYENTENFIRQTVEHDIDE